SAAANLSRPVNLAKLCGPCPLYRSATLCRRRKLFPWCRFPCQLHARAVRCNRQAPPCKEAFMSKSSSRAARHTKIAQPKRPTLEVLEDRTVPSGNTISGFVYQDANNNGIFDSGELAIAGTTIQLRNSANQVIGTATTNAQGYYLFDHDATVSTAPATLTRTVTFQPTATDFTLSGLLDRFDPAQGQWQSIQS